MSGSGSHGVYGNPAWGAPPSGGTPGWEPPPRGPHWGSRWNSGSEGPSYGPPPWREMGSSRILPVVAMVLGFIWFWPVGLAILGYMIWSGRMGCRGMRGRAEYWRGDQGREGAGWRGGWAAWRDWCHRDTQPAGSGNRAFDDYRAETLRRLEQEQQEFAAFLDRLRFARDKSEFDQFMTERRQAPPAPPTDQPQAG